MAACSAGRPSKLHDRRRRKGHVGHRSSPGVLRTSSKLQRPNNMHGGGGGKRPHKANSSLGACAGLNFPGICMPKRHTRGTCTQHVRDPSCVCISTYALRQEFSDLPTGPNHAVLLVKHFRSGAQLAQCPLMVFPEVFVQRLSFADLKPLPRNTLSAREISEFSKTARIVQQPPWNLSGAASYFKSIIDNNQKRHLAIAATNRLRE